jgi:type II secretory pathway component PulF
MALFKYTAKTDPEHTIEGCIEARSEREAVDKISALGYIPVHIEESSGTAPRKDVCSQQPVLSVKINSREVTLMSRQLASLLKSGVPILNALSIIAEQSENASLAFVIRDIRTAVKEGGVLSSTLLRYPAVFTPLYVAMIRIGENSGSLPEVLLRIADYRAKQEEMLSRFRMALAYPILMGIVGIATIVFMFTFVMPRLMNIYVTMDQRLPLPTQLLIAVSTAVRNWGIWIAVALTAVVLIVRLQLKTKTARMFVSALSLRMPVLGKFILKAELSRFCRTLELLLKTGIPILKAIDITVPVIGNEVIGESLKKSYLDLEQGGSFGRSLKGSPLFPLFMSNLISVGEESGKLDDALGEVASSYERDTDEAIKVMGNLIEPVMILVLGLIVGFIVVAMLLPIFEINIMVR